MNRLDFHGGVEDKSSVKTYGYDTILADLRTEIGEFFEIETPLSPYLLTVKGQIGQGKTIFVLNLIDELHKTNSFKYWKTWKGDGSLPIIAGNINPESDLSFLNVWRPILR